MSKPEYANRFFVIINDVSREAMLMVLNETPISNENLEITGIERTEVIKLVMNEYTLRELHKAIEESLEKSTEKQLPQ